MTKQISGWQIAWMLVKAPIMGAAFALFLPFIGIGMLFWFLGKKIFAAVAEWIERYLPPKQASVF